MWLLGSNIGMLWHANVYHNLSMPACPLATWLYLMEIVCQEPYQEKVTARQDAEAICVQQLTLYWHMVTRRPPQKTSDISVNDTIILALPE